MAQRGDKCPNGCGGQLIVRTSRTSGQVHVQWLRCNRCGIDGGAAVMSAERVIRRTLYVTTKDR